MSISTVLRPAHSRTIATLCLSVAVAITTATPLAAQTEPRRPASEPATSILDRMGIYVGHWRSDTKTAQDGSTHHFEIDLSWYDPAETVAKLVITQIFANGSETLLWEGFKGRMQDGAGVYYHASSTGGRTASGEVFLDGDDFITEFAGWSSVGPGVHVRDIFGPVDGTTFHGRTLLKTDADEDFREINQDVWTRIGME